MLKTRFAVSPHSAVREKYISSPRDRLGERVVSRYTEKGSGYLTQPEYRALAEFRYHIRRFLRFSEQAAREAGLEAQQYQLLLALKAEAAPPTMGDIADRMQIQHHSAVELVNRSEQNGLVQRNASDIDRRKVMLQLTPQGERVLRQLARHHRAALSTMAPVLLRSLQGISRTMRKGSARKSRTAPATPVEPTE
jgi:DNA-binding MarR family transcriptional regulator